jgi:hypothetical protein
MNIIIAGSRTFTEYSIISRTVNMILAKWRFNKEFDILYSGCAKGVDTLAIDYAKEKGIKYKEFPANWEIHGNDAGPIRNSKMIASADGLVAFWDGKSKDTKDIIGKAERKGIKVHIVRIDKLFLVK